MYALKSITNYLLVLRWNDYVSALGNGTAAVHTVHHTISVVYNKLPVGVEVELKHVCSRVYNKLPVGVEAE